jgi:hypothetical protein
MNWGSFTNGFWAAMGLGGSPQQQGGHQGATTATQGEPAKDKAAVDREEKIRRLDKQLELLGVCPDGAQEQERQNLQKLYKDAKELVGSGLEHSSDDPQCAKKVEKAVNSHKAEFEKVQTRVSNQLKGWKEGLERLSKRVAEHRKPAPGREAGEAGEIDKLAVEAEKAVSAGLANVTEDALAQAEAAVNTLGEKVAKVGEAVAVRAGLVAACGKELEAFATKPLAGATVAEGQDREKLVGEARKVVAASLQGPTEAALKEAQVAVQGVAAKVGEIGKAMAARADKVSELSGQVEKFAAKPLAGETVAEAQQRGKLVLDAQGAVASGRQAPSDTALTTVRAALKDLEDKVQEVEKAIAGRAVLLGDMKKTLAAVAAPDDALGEEKVKIEERVGEATKLIETGLAAPTDVAVQEAMKAVDLATDERDRAEQNVQLRKGWKKRVEDARVALDERGKKVVKEFFKSVKEDVSKSDELRVYTEKRDAALASLSEANVKAVEDAAARVKALMDAREEHYNKVKTLPADLAAKEKATRDFRDLCVRLVKRADTAWDPIATSFMAGTPLATEFGEDRITVESARVSADDLLTKVTACLSKLGAAKAAAGDISEGLALVGTALRDIAAAQKRIEKNHASLMPAGLKDRVRELADAAGRDDNKRLSNDRAGRLVDDFGKTPCTLPEARNMVDEAVRQQHHPKLRDWLKVLQLSKGGEVRAGNVGDITPASTGTRTTVHLTLHIVNVDAGLPSVLDGADTIMDALLPPLTGQMGTHVTLELFGAKAPSQNPHCFRNGTTVQNSCQDSDWVEVRKGMIKLLDKEMDRLKGLVQQFIANRGLYPSDRRAG